MVNQGIEIEAPNLEEAIKKGLEELSLKEKEQMEWEVLSKEEEGGTVKLKVKKKEETPVKPEAEAVSPKK